MAAFKAAGISVHPTGIEHGTVTVVVDHTPYEITTLRHDVETDGRRAVVAFTDDWKADALRRDFTINALYCDASGKIHDHVGGYADILRKRIMFVGAPAARIKEDNLRILRFFRFLASYEKMSADRASLAACVRLRKGLLGLSAERIAREMFKLLAGPKALPVLKLMARHKVLQNVLGHSAAFRVIGRLPPDPLLRAFALAKKPESLRAAWRLANQQSRRIEARFPDPLANPYLCFAALLMAGLDGIRNKIDPGPASDKDLYDLPPEELAQIPTVCGSLREALEELERDMDFLVAGDVFTRDQLESYMALKWEEVYAFEHTPHPVEYLMYYSC